MNAYRVYQQIVNGEISASDFHDLIQVHAETVNANSRLSNLQCEQRYENSNRMVKSYMDEFESRGLVYIPKLEEKND
jgi:hypothetical protein